MTKVKFLVNIPKINFYIISPINTKINLMWRILCNRIWTIHITSMSNNFHTTNSSKPL